MLGRFRDDCPSFTSTIAAALLEGAFGDSFQPSGSAFTPSGIGALGSYSINDCNNFAASGTGFTGNIFDAGDFSGCYQENFGSCAVWFCGFNGQIDASDLAVAIQTITSAAGNNACVLVADSTHPSLEGGVVCLGNATQSDAGNQVCNLAFQLVGFANSQCH